MAKTVYSLVLSSEIIAEIDKMSAREGLSRSGLVNRVLAEYASLSTPEGRLRQVAQATADSALLQGLRSDISASGALTLRTALRYKYNPALHYTLELYESGPLLGELRVSVRSQNENLLACIEMFFVLFGRLEAAHLQNPPLAGQQAYAAKKFTRRLRRHKALQTEHETGQALAAYINTLNSCIHTFFENLHDANEAVRATEACYKQALAKWNAAAQL